jgi:iron(III) transport system ATP-binding protein
MNADSVVLDVRSLRKVYGNGHPALQAISLTLENGRSLVVVGGSGSGKSTFVRCLAGLEMPDEGSIAIAGDMVFDTATKLYVPPERRRLSMMFQDYALWPHMSVQQNVRYPIRRMGDEAAIGRRVEQTLDMVGCLHLSPKQPAELSGGEQQRVALARALVGRPTLLLADEPFSNLDTTLRDRIRGEFVAMRRQAGFSLVHVTHDPREAMMLGDTLLVLHRSKAEDFGQPLRIYTRPRSVIAAQALGMVNQLSAVIAQTHGPASGQDATRVTLSTAAGTFRGLAPSRAAVGDRVTAITRPSHLRVDTADAEPGPDDNVAPVEVRFSISIGDLTTYSIILPNGEEMRAEWFHGPLLEPGSKVRVTFSAATLWAIPDSS